MANKYVSKIKIGADTAYVKDADAVKGPSSAVTNRVAAFDGTTGKLLKDSGYTIAKSVPSDALFTDRYVNSASFAHDSTNNNVKMTLTRAGSDTATVNGNIPKVSSSSAGVAPKGAAVSSQSQSTKFLREDGTWAAPSYTTTSVFSSSANGLAPAASSGNKTTAETSLSKYYLCDDAKFRQLPTSAFSSSGYGVCNTFPETNAKTVTISNYNLIPNSMVSIYFTYDVLLNATLNINNTGAKNILYRGEGIVNGTINADTMATFIYDGTQYQLIATDVDAHLLGGFSISSWGTSESHYDLNNLTTIGIYTVANRESSLYFDNQPELSSNYAFRILVSRTKAALTDIRQVIEYKSLLLHYSYERYSTDSGTTWSDWVLIQNDLNNLNYVKRAGGTMTGTLTTRAQGRVVIEPTGSSYKKGNVSISVTHDIIVINMTGDITGFSFTTDIIGQEITVIFTSTAARNVTIANSATYVCPEGTDLSLSVPANGHKIVKFIHAEGRFFVQPL